MVHKCPEWFKCIKRYTAIVFSVYIYKPVLT